jgi:hypothetical protein
MIAEGWVVVDLSVSFSSLVKFPMFPMFPMSPNVTNLASFLALTLVPCSPDFCFLILERMCLMVHVPTTMD